MSNKNATFEVGEIVAYANRAGGASAPCTVVKVMPIEHDVRSYHVRDETESFERAVAEGELTRVRPSERERVFGL